MLKLLTQEEKELLLKDLCARLPYDVIVKISHRVVDGKTGKVIKEECHDKTLSLWNEDLLHKAISNIKPYLRPMSSMTEDEKKEYELLANHCIVTSIGFIHLETASLIDWLNKKMFDYHGLIPMGLAFEAPEGMYKQ